MSVQSIQTIIKELQKETTILVRQPVSFSWCNNITEAGELLETIFKEVDKTVEYFQWLDEYYHVKSWMMNTEGKGLLLMGSCGRGKSVIASGVIPVLFRMKGKYLRPVHAQDMTKPTPQQPYLAYGQRPETWLDYLQRCPFPIIDELGVEMQVNDYGEKCEGFNLVINAAERYNRPMFITTNLTEEQILARYGERTLDRLGHLCKTVKFTGESLRK
jgi:DNA replication protein DnaC